MKKIVTQILIILSSVSILTFCIISFYSIKDFIIEGGNLRNVIFAFLFVIISFVIVTILVNIILKYFDKKYIKFRSKSFHNFKFFDGYFYYRDSRYSNELFFRKHNWEEIKKVFLFKRDLMSVDQIGISIKFTNKEIFITEDVIGWKDFLNEFDKHFPNVKIWEEISDISYPPFEEKGKIIYVNDGNMFNV